MIDFCKIRDIQKGLNELEDDFRQKHNICLHEGSVLCRLYDCCLTSSEIAKCAELKASHTSKTIRSLEDKGLITRQIGEEDKRVMKFVLSKSGKQLLDEIRQSEINIPNILLPILPQQ